MMTTLDAPANDQTPMEYPATRSARCPLDPPPELLAKQAESRLTKVRIMDGSLAWLVTRYEDQRDIMADPRVSANSQLPGYPSPVAKVAGRGPTISFILMDDPDHARLRKMVTTPFMIKRINALRPRIQEITDQLIDDILAGPKPVDLVQAFALPLPSLVICDLLGVPYSDHDFFQETSKGIVTRGGDPEGPMRARLTLTDYLQGVIESKMAEPSGDVLSDLGVRVKNGELTINDAAQMGMLLLFAGHETTANMIALGTLALLQNPDQMTLVREGHEEVAITATEELLRYLHITHHGRRRLALEDIEFAGETIKAGDGIICPNDIANRDPEAFDEPDRLDVTRDARHHVAFGFGVHQCLGQPLARAELQIVYSTLYRRIPTLKLAVDIKDLDFKHDAAVYGVEELPVTW